MGRAWGTLQPEEFSVVQQVFKRIARDAWFKDDIETLNRFGLIVLHTYGSGITDEEQLFARCSDASRQMEATH